MDKIKYLIGSEAYDSLLNANISSIEHILMVDIKIIQDVTGATLDVINNMLLTVTKEMLKNKFQTADKIEPWGRICTRCENLDAILLGGIPMNGISEIYGCSGVGKTQFCLQMALNIQLPNQLGSKRKEVIYISTEDVFPSKRLVQMANAYRQKHSVQINFEDHIYIKHLANSVQLQKCLSQLHYFLSRKNVGLIVIDSITGLFRSENENPSYASRSHEFKLISKALNNLQDQYNCAVLIVNQVRDNTSTGMPEPCLGLSWANNVTCRFCLSRNGTNSTRKFEVIFAPDLLPRSSNIIISTEGLLDAYTVNK